MSKTVRKTEDVSTVEAARLLNCSDQMVGVYVKDGRLTNVSGSKRVHAFKRSEVMALRRLAARKKKGARFPAKKKKKQTQTDAPITITTLDVGGDAQPQTAQRSAPADSLLAATASFSTMISTVQMLVRKAEHTAIKAERLEARLDRLTSALVSGASPGKPSVNTPRPT